ncbi:MAG: type I DNA topoisomerase [Bacteroidetes bacterium]|uniref:DNA topoisomerase 1 n=1 Tax=Candidatus Merdivivens pullicola TaxID=2840872 RepID=A0A9D9IJ17_9BACT|nr:type I DNA topoisomerase [Candidatus Merdivivens pullicola]
MGKNLVIVESPAKAKTIQQFLGKDFSVKSSFGHIRDLHTNTISVDIEHGFKPEYVIPEDKKKLVQELENAAKSADIVWLASDEDREGEAIAWHLKETLGLKDSNTKRIAFHEITKNAILAAIASPRDVDMNLVNAQQARRVLDRLVGFELSPVLWRRIQPKLSAGRVQSVALRLIVDKEREIIGFKPSRFYRTEGLFLTPEKIQVKGVLDKRFPDIETASAFVEKATASEWKVTGIEKKTGTRSPGAPFTTSTLQQEAARKLRFSVRQTMSIAQKLYEEGIITYMRTDSTNLSSLAINTAKQYITDNFGEEYSKPRQFKTKSKGAQEAHEAIRPTYIDRTDIEGTAQEKKLYRLIRERTLASQMSDARIEKTEITIGSDNMEETFGLQAVKIVFDGFMKIYSEGPSEDGKNEEDSLPTLPGLEKGQNMEMTALHCESKFTPAPARYTEGTLVKKLEELGIGRPSTYDPTISTLKTKRGYIYQGDIPGKQEAVTDIVWENGQIERKSGTVTVGAEKNRLIPHNVGIVVCDYLVKGFERIMDYGFTADVEKYFDKIAEGKMEWSALIAGFYKDFHKSVENSPTPDPEARELGTDPATGAKILAKFGKYGAYAEKTDRNGNSEYVSLADDMLIESVTLEEVLKLFAFPKELGNSDYGEVAIHKGPYGPYIKCAGKNYPLPKGTDPYSVTLEEAVEIIRNKLEKVSAPLLSIPEEDITVLDGRFGPYIRHNGNNYKIPKDIDAARITPEQCREIISSTQPAKRKSKKK